MYHSRFTPVISPNELPSPKGWKARQLVSNARNSERNAALEGSRLRQYITYVSNAQSALGNAIEKRDELQRNIQSKHGRLEIFKKELTQHGRVNPELRNLQYIVDDVLPELLVHAEAEIVAAREKVAVAEKQRDEAFAAHDARLAAEEDGEGEAEPDAVEGAPRGRGRPRKS